MNTYYLPKRLQFLSRDVRSERVENAWERRIRELKGWVGIPERREVSRKEEEAKVAAAISRRGYEEWRGEIEKRGSLKYYKKKTRIGMTDWYNGSRGGELLLHARTGSLCTEGKIARNKGEEEKCRRCIHRVSPIPGKILRYRSQVLDY